MRGEGGGGFKKTDTPNKFDPFRVTMGEGGLEVAKSSERNL